ncbi:hypothetical protein [Lactococcus allomyrinae]|uniref:Uncharacterized protein n=1 Tax=Lactococcus allomyrinae TaxID=2419773 RepID=A0A387BJW0_9LACT|nr:hypothetical protein [Lactococcus allomyrinae]AYG01306.1 hypothetical protein D7I46_09490 [Lactococcus allomyrinae]
MKEEINNIQKILHQKTFWKIQGLNLFLVLRKIVSYLLIVLSLIFVVSLTSQALDFSNGQREKILNLILLLVTVVNFIKGGKKVFQRRAPDLEVVKTFLNVGLWWFLIYLAFSIQLTDYERINELLQRWFVVGFLFEVSHFFIFRHLAQEIKTGKKSDWVRRIDGQKKSNYQDGLLLFTEVSETYHLKYTRVYFKFNSNEGHVAKIKKGIKGL